MRKWDFTRATHWDIDAYDGPIPSPYKDLAAKEQNRFDELLDDGWEPLSVHPDPNITTRTHVWLRRPL